MNVILGDATAVDVGRRIIKSLDGGRIRLPDHRDRATQFVFQTSGVARNAPG
jgi:hypothetical protein